MPARRRTVEIQDLTPASLADASYGGYMAAWILGHTDRFKAIVNHAGVNNSHSPFATDVPHGFARVMGGTPTLTRPSFDTP